jgi:hypothetical protein
MSTIILFAIFTIVPCVSLCIMWRGIVRHRQDPSQLPRRGTFLPMAVTLSSLWFVSGLFWNSIWGPAFSPLRFAILEGNIALSVCIGIVGALMKRPYKWALVISAGIAAGEWLIALALNAGAGQAVLLGANSDLPYFHSTYFPPPVTMITRFITTSIRS